METTVQWSQVPGLTSPTFYEYLLVVHPTEEVYNRVYEEKKHFSSQYGVSVARKTLPHITVANFLAYEPMEETIIRYMNRIAGMRKSFGVTLNNYGSFRPHTVYLRVQNHEPFKQMAVALKAIDNYIQSCKLPAAYLVNNPHLTIARRLQRNEYETAVAHYSKKTFQASFEVNALVLLRRQNQFDRCKEISVFKLLPPDNIASGFSQQNLFNLILWKIKYQQCLAIVNANSCSYCSRMKNCGTAS